MNLTQLIQRVRDELDDPLLLKHSDAELARHVDEQVRSMFRTMIRSGTEWSNLSVALKKDDARTLFQNTHEWRLPSWIEKVSRVWERNPSDTTNELTFSPYNWTSDPNIIGREIPKTDSNRKAGWTWDGTRTFRVWNMGSEPRDYLLHVAAMPPPVFQITIANAHTVADDQKLYLPATATLGDLTFREEGRYVNAEIEATGTASATDLKLGEIRRTVYSSILDDAGTRRHELRFEFPFSSVVAVGDSFETVIPVPDIHLRLLILKIVNACAIKMFNVDLQRAITGEMQQETSLFSDYAQGPRDKAGPYFKTSRESSGNRYDPDRYTRPGILGWWRA